MTDPIAVDRRTAAQMLGVSVTRMDELIASGRVETHYEGRKPLVDVESLRAYYKNLPLERAG